MFRYRLCVLQRRVDGAATLVTGSENSSSRSCTEYHRALSLESDREYAMGVCDTTTGRFAETEVTFRVPAVTDDDRDKKKCTKRLSFNGGSVQAQYVFHKKSATHDLSCVLVTFKLAEVSGGDHGGVLHRFGEAVALHGRNAVKVRAAEDRVKRRERAERDAEENARMRAHIEMLLKDLETSERCLDEEREALAAPEPELEPEPELF